MNNKMLFPIIVIVIFAVAYLFFVQNSKKTEVTIKEDKSNKMMQKEKETSKDVKMMQQSMSYLHYTENALSDNKGKKRVIFFYANWCPTCKPVDEELAEKAKELPSDLAVIRVNYSDSDTDDSEKALARKYNITYQHTYVLIDQNENEIKKWNGGGFTEIVNNSK